MLFCAMHLFPGMCFPKGFLIVLCNEDELQPGVQTPIPWGSLPNYYPAQGCKKALWMKMHER